MRPFTMLATDKQYAALKKEAVETEISISEQVRRAISLWLKKRKKEREEDGE